MGLFMLVEKDCGKRMTCMGLSQGMTAYSTQPQIRSDRHCRRVRNETLARLILDCALVQDAVRCIPR